MGEKVKDAVIREVKEETGYDIEINRLSVFAIRAHMSRFLTQNIIDGEFLTFPFHKVIFNPFTQLDLTWMT